MTAERRYRSGPVIFHCDGGRCAEVLETGQGEFQAALVKLREAGWRTVRRGTEFDHICDGCLEERARKQAGAR